MDKNMISIDELVRQRLAGGEEKERPGAWLSMRELLDKEMPVSAPPAAGGNFRRLLGYAAALLLLTGLCTGGYQVASYFREKGDNGQSMPNEMNTTDVAIASRGIGSAVTGNTTATSKNDISSVNTPENVTNSNNSPEAKGIGTSTNTSVGHNNNINNPGPSGNNTNTKLTGVAASSNHNSATKHNKSAEFNVKSNGSNNELNINGDNDNSIANNPTVSADKSAPANTSHIAPNSTAANNNNAGKKGNKNGKDGIGPKPKQNGNNTAGTNNTKDEKAPELTADKDGGTKHVNLQMDSINKIETKQVAIGKGRFKVDTVSKGKIALARYSVVDDLDQLAAMAQVKQSADNLAVVPAAAAPASASEEKMELLANHRVSSKREKWNPTRFEEMVHNAKINMNGVSFYPGLLAGVNTSAVGGKQAFGFQAGITGLVKFSEHWSLFSELKYMNNFNNGTYVSDSYNKGLSREIDPQNPALANYTWDSVVHKYQYSTLGSLQLPLALRYSIGRLNIFGGANMVYNFKVGGLYDGGATYLQRVSRPTDLGPLSWNGGAAKYKVDDFGPRFGLGYMFGASFQASPALQLDMRVATQSLWNNASTYGSKEVFKQLYYNPSIQMNVSYRISTSRYHRNKD